MEPDRFIAGDSVTWTRSDTRYLPSAGWVLTYTFVSPTNTFTITAAANAQNTGWEPSLTGLQTGAYKPGRYRVLAQVTLGDDRHTLWQGGIEIDPNLAMQDSGFDIRTDAQRYLDRLLEARDRMMHGGLSATISAESIGGRSRTFRSLEELDGALQRARRDVNREQSKGKRLANVVRVSL